MKQLDQQVIVLRERKQITRCTFNQVSIQAGV